jgi:hypothetical protein
LLTAPAKPFTLSCEGLVHVKGDLVTHHVITGPRQFMGHCLDLDFSHFR